MLPKCWKGGDDNFIYAHEFIKIRSIDEYRQYRFDICYDRNKPTVKLKIRVATGGSSMILILSE